MDHISFVQSAVIPLYLLFFPSDTKRNFTATLDDRWWHRLLKVAYIILYIPLSWNYTYRLERK